MKKQVLFYLLYLTLILINQIAFCQNKTYNVLLPLDTIIERKMNEGGIVGIGAAIIVNKKLVWIKGYGYADKENKKPFTPHTIMNIGSISKNFMGACLFKAIEERKLNLDEDINTYLPFKVINPFFPNEKITLRHLATHSSSLIDRYPFYESTYFEGNESPETLGDFLKNYFVKGGKYYTDTNFVQHKPGTYYEYSNIPASLAGYIVETVTGKSLHDYAKQHIFKPLKMKRTGWHLDKIDISKHTKLYDKKGDTLKNIALYSNITYPDGGVRTTVNDLSKYFITLLNEGEYEGMRVLEKESMREMQRFQFSALSKPENVNIEKVNSGIFWATKQSVTKMGHSGTDPGIKAEMLTDLNKEVAVILFSNTDLTTRDMIKYHIGIFEELYKYGVKYRELNKR
jgi:CubicO group peptidase (beta-lactamase class C family)